MSFPSSESDEPRDQYSFCLNTWLKLQFEPFSHFCALAFSLHFFKERKNPQAEVLAQAFCLSNREVKQCEVASELRHTKNSPHRMAALDLSFEEGIASPSALVRLFNT